MCIYVNISLYVDIYITDMSLLHTVSVCTCMCASVYICLCAHVHESLQVMKDGLESLGLQC